MAKELTYRIFINGRPFEEIPEEERKEIRHRLTEKMGKALNDWFSTHPEEYAKI